MTYNKKKFSGKSIQLGQILFRYSEEDGVAEVHKYKAVDITKGRVLMYAPSLSKYGVIAVDATYIIHTSDRNIYQYGHWHRTKHEAWKSEIGRTANKLKYLQDK